MPFNIQFEFFHAYMISFFVGFIYAIISAILSGVFGGEVGGHDIDASGHDFDPSIHLEPGMVHFSPLSPTIIATFLTAFGGTGMICLKVFNMSNYGSIPVAIIVALATAGAVFLLLEWIFEKTQASANIDAAGLVGTHADVITPIPENGVGEIAYVVRGTRQNAPARSADGKPIPSPTEVEIVRVVGSSFIVRPLEESQRPSARPPGETGETSAP